MHPLTKLCFLALFLAATPVQAEEEEIPTLGDPFSTIHQEWKKPEDLTYQNMINENKTKGVVATKDEEKKNVEPTIQNAPPTPPAEIFSGWIPIPLKNGVKEKAQTSATTAQESDKAAGPDETKWAKPSEFNRTRNFNLQPSVFTEKAAATQKTISAEGMPDIIVDAPSSKKEDSIIPAAPTRQVNLAPLPVINLPLISAQEKNDEDALQAEIIPYENKALHGGPLQNEWKSLAQIKLTKDSLASDTNVGKNIRLAGMPMGKDLTESQVNAAGKAAQTKSSKEQLAEQKKNLKPAVKKRKTTLTPEACDNVTDYMKKQITAIESDNKTIEALQAAIAELGLNKKLNYLPGNARITNTQ